MTASQLDGAAEATGEDTPRNILEEIVWYKAAEVDGWKQEVSLSEMRGRAEGAPPARDFIGALAAQRQRLGGLPGLIAEVKKASPSRGIICPEFDPVRIARAYEAGGAACLSVLTDAKFFQGGFENLTLIRGAGVSCPLLCKEFVVDEYQMAKARAAGADAVLLIAAVLPNSDLEDLIKSARSLGMQCLIEVHDEAEMARVLDLDLSGCMLGINNRDLRTFVVSLDNSQRIMASEPGRHALARGLMVASESGIFTHNDLRTAAAAGCSTVLVGESLVKEHDPAAAVRQLLHDQGQ